MGVLLDFCLHLNERQRGVNASGSDGFSQLYHTLFLAQIRVKLIYVGA
jgi:hypothetical protein